MNYIEKTTLFAFDDALVRVHKDENGNPWFVAKDVANILDIQNIRQNMQYLDEDEKGVYNLYTSGGNQQVATVSESGLDTKLAKISCLI